MSHPAWEDYIVWKNKERHVEELKEQAKFGSWAVVYNKDVKESELDEDYEKAIRDVLGFIRRKLAEYMWE